MKKNKFIDKCKSWLLTLGIASVFGLAALGVNAAKSYEKASAYQYQDNGSLVFSYSDYDFDILYHYVLSYGVYDSEEEKYFIDTSAVLQGDDDSRVLDSIFSDEYSTIIFAWDWYSDGYISYSLADSSWSVADNPDGFQTPISSITFTSSNTESYQSLRNYALSYNAPQESGNFITALTSFMSLLGGAIVQLATPVASGVTSFASALFIDNSHLSILGGIIGIFAGIALAVGITSKVYAWVSTLGN